MSGGRCPRIGIGATVLRALSGFCLLPFLGLAVCAVKERADPPAASRAVRCRGDTECASERVCEEDRCVHWWKLRGETPELTPAAVQRLVENGEIQVLDVRTPGEFRCG